MNVRDANEANRKTICPICHHDGEDHMVSGGVGDYAMEDGCLGPFDTEFECLCDFYLEDQNKTLYPRGDV